MTAPWIARALLLLVAATVCATPGLAKELVNGQGILRRIDHGSVPPSHLFGTMHSADERVLDMPPGAQAAFAAADTLALELLLARPEAKQRAAMVLGQSFLLTDGRSLDALIGEQRFTAVSNALARIGLPPMVARIMKPWSAYLLVNAPPPRLDADGAPIPALDARLELDARAAGKKLVALESIEEQADLFASKDEAAEIKLLGQLVDTGEARGGLTRYLDALFTLMLELYDAEDIGTIIEITQPPMPPEDQAALEMFMERAIWRRNARMVERMDSLIAHGNAFIAIGAAHLPGEKGIVNMLVKRGYKITRVQ